MHLPEISRNLVPNQKRKIDLNHDNALWLEMLPGVGPKRAQALIQQRPFSSLEDVLKVKGISKRLIQRWQQEIKSLD